MIELKEITDQWTEKQWCIALQNVVQKYLNITHTLLISNGGTTNIDRLKSEAKSWQSLGHTRIF